MTKLQEAYATLVSAAQELGKEHWACTGNMPPQENAMFAVLAILVNELAREIDELQKGRAP